VSRFANALISFIDTEIMIK